MLQQLLRRLESQATDLGENRAASVPALAAAVREVHGPYGFPGSPHDAHDLKAQIEDLKGS